MSLAEIVVLALVVFRVARLLAVDEITANYRARVYAWAWDDDNPRAEADELGGVRYDPTPRAGPFRTYVEAFVRCPHCWGMWLSIPAVWLFAVTFGRTFTFAEWIVYVLAVAGAQSLGASFAAGRANA